MMVGHNMGKPMVVFWISKLENQSILSVLIRLVTSELVFYVSSLQSLHVLSEAETVEAFSKDLWNNPQR